MIIGVAAVIAMTEIGQGSKTAMQKTIASMGANMLLVLPGAAMTGSVSYGTGTMQTLKPADMDEILPAVPGGGRRGARWSGRAARSSTATATGCRGRSTAPRPPTWPSATGRAGRGRRLHRPRRAQRQPRSA